MLHMVVSHTVSEMRVHSHSAAAAEVWLYNGGKAMLCALGPRSNRTTGEPTRVETDGLLKRVILEAMLATLISTKSCMHSPGPGGRLGQGHAVLVAPAREPLGGAPPGLLHAVSYSNI